MEGELLVFRFVFNSTHDDDMVSSHADQPLGSISRKKHSCDSSQSWPLIILKPTYLAVVSTGCGNLKWWTEENHALLMSRCCIKCDTDVTWHLKGDRLSLAGSMMDAPLRFLLLLTGLGLSGKNIKSDHMFQTRESLDLLILIAFCLDSAWKWNHQRSQGPWQWNAVYGLSAKCQWSSCLRRVPHQ